MGHQLRISRESRLRNGSYEYGQVNINSAGYDDLLTRGNGVLWLPPNFNTFFEYERPRIGSWAYEVELEVRSGGLSGNDQIGYWFNIEPRYFISDSFNVYLGVENSHTPDWLVWQFDNLIGSFESRETDLNAGFTWNVANRHELRLKLQAIGLSARLRQAYRVQGGEAIPTDEPVDDFSVETLGVQLRYRYEFRPLSYLYVVYGRGGYRQEPVADDAGSLVQRQLRAARRRAAAGEVQLPIRELVPSHQGLNCSVWTVAGSVGASTTFTLSLPRAQLNASVMLMAESVSESASRQAPSSFLSSAMRALRSATP